jgi:hypothetical protein
VADRFKVRGTCRRFSDLGDLTFVCVECEGHGFAGIEEGIEDADGKDEAPNLPRFTRNPPKLYDALAAPEATRRDVKKQLLELRLSY